eukprot:306287-Prymnesium_polylepis.1
MVRDDLVSHGGGLVTNGGVKTLACPAAPARGPRCACTRRRRCPSRSPAISGNQCSQLQSVAISGDQWQSPAAGR